MSNEFILKVGADFSQFKMGSPSLATELVHNRVLALMAADVIQAIRSTAGTASPTPFPEIAEAEFDRVAKLTALVSDLEEISRYQELGHTRLQRFLAQLSKSNPSSEGGSDES